MPEPIIVLREITRLNFNQCIKLTVADDQKDYVASNVYSLAQAKSNHRLFPFAIYGDEVMGRLVEERDEIKGFVMYQLWEGVGFIMRLMVDQRFQGQGYGSAAMIEVIRRLKMNPETERIATSIHKDNKRVIEFYNKLGFTIPLEEKNNEVYFKLDWDR